MDIKDFDFTYAGVDEPSLKKINLPIEKNKITAMIGPSGCGKSTLLRAMNRIHDLYPGILMRERSIFTAVRARKRNILDLKKENDLSSCVNR